MRTFETVKELISMAVRFEVDFVNRLVRTTFTEVVTHWDHSEHTLRLGLDPAFDPSFSELICFDEKASIRLGFLDFRAESDPFSKDSKRAIVAARTYPAVYGIARMFQLVRREGANVKIFQTIPEAEAWLGLPCNDKS
jgi:hypothetical protein